ncbi:hypothetical protein SPRG_17696, partial [Saprolegnia parasitica CBS 223.65]
MKRRSVHAGKSPTLSKRKRDVVKCLDAEPFADVALDTTSVAFQNWVQKEDAADTAKHGGSWPRLDLGRRMEIVSHDVMPSVAPLLKRKRHAT